MIIPENNKGCRWHNIKEIYAKGCLFNNKNKLFRNHELITYFDGVKDAAHFMQKLKDANGLFSVIINYGDEVLAAVDRARCFPLFYTLKDNDIIISDSVEALLKQTGSGLPDETASQGFLAAGYVSGSRTLIRNISQIRAGEYICFSNGIISTGFFHTFIPECISESSTADLVNNILKCIDVLSERTAILVKNKVPVIPLSSGFDSRFIAAILKNIGVKDAICFTYGRKNNYEIDISKKVAEKLGYRWLFIEYNGNMIDGYLENPVFHEYYKYSANHSAMFFMQEYFAIKSMRENNLIPDNSLFIPGHSGDVLAGGHLWKDINEKTNPARLAKLIYEKNYILNKPSGAAKRFLIDEISRDLPGSAFPFALFQNWELKERHAKFIVNSANIYNFFGYEYIMPLWDLDLLNFFTVLPYRHRIFKNFYNDILKKHVFSRHGLNFDPENLPPDRLIKIQLYKNKVKRYIPGIIKRPFYHHPDPFCYKEITGHMINDMIKREYKVNTGVQYENAYIVQWYLYKVMESLNFAAES
jgi:asparagine synthase (glutamine-hydrolysing)